MQGEFITRFTIRFGSLSSSLQAIIWQAFECGCIFNIVGEIVSGIEQVFFKLSCEFRE